VEKRLKQRLNLALQVTINAVEYSEVTPGQETTLAYLRDMLARKRSDDFATARAANSHAELVAALEQCLTVIEFEAAAAGKLESVKASPGYIAARAALNKAKAND